MIGRRPRLLPTPAMVEDLEQYAPGIRGKRVADVPELAGFRVHFRRRFYGMADFFFASCIFHAMVAIWSPFAFLAALHRGAFVVSFVMMFFCEFRARLMTRQLHRRAAEQLALDLLGNHRV